MTSPPDAATQWGSVASAWDELVEHTDTHTRAPTEELIGRLAAQPGDRLLELGAGPGSLGPLWSSLVGDSGSVVVSDIAPEMVEVARRRCAGLGNVETAVLDACAIDRPDGSFDVVACRMGLMFAPDPAAAYGEIRRVLADGGRFAALTWAGAEHNRWVSFVGMAAAIAGITEGPPPSGPGTMFSLADPALVEDLAVNAGFSEVEVSELAVTFEADSIDGHIETISRLAGPLAAAFAAADEHQLAAARAAAAELMTPFATAGGVSIPGLTVLVSARA